MTAAGLLAPTLSAARFGLVHPVLVPIGDRQGVEWIGPANNVQAFTEGQFLIVVMIWIQAGFAMTVLPDGIIEAARLDGLGGALREGT